MTDILDLDGWTVLSKTTDPEGHDLLEAEALVFSRLLAGAGG